MKFVVARYQENVDWTNGLPDCVIYNKGPTAVPASIQHPVIVLPNVGREGHTYLFHIIQNYDMLDNYTCFLQGNPFDHTPDLESRINQFEAKMNKPDFTYVSRDLYQINLCYDPTDFSLHALLMNTYEKVFGVAKKDHAFQFGAGAQFIVSRAAIQRRPKSFYENIVPLLDYANCPAEGFAMERFWGMIFRGAE